MYLKQETPTSFRVVNGQLAILNAFRRIILSEIPNLAFDSDAMTIHKNTSNLNNEFLSHRLSLVPIHFDPCKISEVLKYKFKIHLKNTGNTPINITTKNIDAYDENNNIIPKDVVEALFPYNSITRDHILITHLMPNLLNQNDGQEVIISMQPIQGISKTNSKWCPVSQCSFMNVIDEEAAAIARESAQDLSVFDTHTKYRFFKRNCWNEPNEFIMYIDSECAMSPSFLLSKAKQILMDKVKKIINNIHNLSFKFVTAQMLEIEIPQEDFTLLNVIQSSMYNMYIREVEGTNQIIDFVGYYQPHPLEHRMILKLHFTQSQTIEYVQEFVASHCNHLLQNLDNVVIA